MVPNWYPDSPTLSYCCDRRSQVPFLQKGSRYRPPPVIFNLNRDAGSQYENGIEHCHKDPGYSDREREHADKTTQEIAINEESTSAAQEMDEDTDEPQDAAQMCLETAKELKRQFPRHHEGLLVEAKDFRAKIEQVEARIPSQVASEL